MESVISHQSLCPDIPSKTELAFQDLNYRLQQEAESLSRKVDAVLGFKITDCPGGHTESWVIDLRQGRGVVGRANGQKADIIFQIAENDLVELLQGRQQPQKLLLTRRLRISGTKSLQNKVQYLVVNKRRKSKL